MAIERIGVFGGTFDPVHYGHLLMAEQCREQLELTRVLFVPAQQSPLKSHGPQATPRQRVEMLRMAIAGHADFQVSEIELERPPPSFTVDTLQHLAEANPTAELFFILGSDSLAEFDRWRSPRRIIELAVPVVVARPGSAADLAHLQPLAAPERWAKIQAAVVRTPLVELSSTDLRARIATGRSVRYMTPRAVEVYLQTHQVYSAHSPTS